MKKYLILSIIFILSITSLRSQDYRYIPDSNFRYVLRIEYSCPFDSSGDSIDISSSIVNNLDSFYCMGRGISNLEGIKYLSNLKKLYCSANNLTSLPDLPDSLKILDFTNNLLTELPILSNSLIEIYCINNLIDTITILPDSLKKIDCSDNLLRSLAPLPVNLVSLNCRNNHISLLPSLPNNLTLLDCSSNNLTNLPLLPNTIYYLICNNNTINSLPSLSSNLVVIDCSNNLIDSIPPLPPILSTLKCDNNLLTSLPSISPNLYYLYCQYNLLSSLPTLLNSLIEIKCDHNLLTSIPRLPNSISILNCNNNPLNCLPYIPSNLALLNYDSTNVNCIPNITGSFFTSIPPFGTHPFCNPISHSCNSYMSINGFTFLDDNFDCNIDSTEDRVNNITLVLENDTTILQLFSSGIDGIYKFDTLNANTYTVHIDTLNIPFYVSCLVSGYDTIIIDSSLLSYTDRNFALNCKPGFDIATSGIIRTTFIRPATPATFNLHAGDIANLYGVHCTNIAGKISIDYSGPMHYSGVEAGTLIPDSILPNRLVWNITDFSLLDFNEAIKPNFFVDSSAIAGDLVCFTTEVSPIIGDRVPSNNTFSQCFDVRASYDPNIKEVSPSGSITSSQDWLYYTIHFQNTGNSYAENIYVWDTIDPNLNLNSIKVMGASHNQYMQVFNMNRSVRFNFININLEDSTTNEPASHGWVQYRIKPNASLAEGTNIHNTASILFDLNTPVVTNTVTTNICNTTTTVTQTRVIGEGDVVHVGSHTYSHSGSYTEILSNIHGCDSTVNTIVQVVNGQLEINAINFIVYPNPSNNQVFIQLEGMPTANLNIVDMYGRTVFESNSITNKFQINTENWSNGTYIIQCGSSRAKLVVSH